MANKKKITLGQRLQSAFNRIQRFDFATKSPSKILTLGEVRLLTTIMFEQNEEGRVPLSELTPKVMLAPSALSQMLRNLERRQMIRREQSPFDRRAVDVLLTEEGAEHLAEIQKLENARYDALIKHIGKEDAEKLANILEEIIDYVESK